MKNNYKRLGDYIQLVNVRNKDTVADELLGINIDNFFMPSVANVIGTNLSRYKLVYKNQFACNRMHVGRDLRIPIAISKTEKPFMVSPAYDVFEVKKTDELLPDYLMMWLKRPEFDRECAFHTDADVRGGLSWKDFCDLTLPIPSLERQQEIVADFQAVEQKIKTNEAICEKLEETAQTIYRSWFEEFEFPDENGKPYKSNGGKMVWNEELEKKVPEGWEVKRLEEVVSIKHGYAFKGKNFSTESTDIVLISPGNFSVNGGFNFEKNKFYNGEIVEDYILNENDFIVNMTDLSKAGDTLGNTAIVPKINFKTLQHNQRVGLFLLKNESYLNYIYFLTQTQEYKYFILGTATGTTVRHTSPKRIVQYKLVFPTEDCLNQFNKYVQPIIERIKVQYSISYYLKKLQTLLLVRMTREEELVEM